ncbi:FecR domain-containing protein [Dyadobacter sp. 676]|uniref:FecR domain-containing protein n=1 Tax=Dyadobacter sp. 676 TaxID=3088362 RepID=A0AAU8FE41_9BACT
MNYRDYTANDFVADPFFRSWVLDDAPDAMDFWQSWLKEHPDRREEVDEARAFLYVLAERKLRMGAGELDGRVQRLIAQVREEAGAAEKRRRRAFYQIFGIAASVCMIAAGGWWGYRQVVKSPVGQQGIAGKYYKTGGNVVYFNKAAKPVTVRLEDGSMVSINPESELEYPEKFTAAKREVHLKGEAFFRITRDARRPFIVVTKELVTQVLGTSFTVRSFEKDLNASVAVKTGRVSVFPKAGNGSPAKEAGMLLKPNQRVVFDKREAKLVKVIVETPVRVSDLPAAALVFDEAPVRKVFKSIENEYGIKILYNEEALSACLLTANLSGLSMYEQLDLICRIIHAGYKVSDGQIVVSGEGCRPE